MRPQAVSALPAPHPVDRASAIELRAALAQAQDRTVAQVEGERAVLVVDPDLLDELAVPGLDADRQRVGRDRDPSVAHVNRARLARGRHAQARRTEVVSGRETRWRGSPGDVPPRRPAR